MFNNKLKVLDKEVKVKYSEEKIKKLENFFEEVIILANLMGYKIETEFSNFSKDTLMIIFSNNQKEITVVIVKK